ncbi:hypothetical protein [Photorhabdus antumapuensis]|uniref:hypothetical protein n=1 Tax=Photorhabdus antumapuensis TaxID=2862867 RepID=UPI001CEC1E19|nr:hypothetical protein [Photorhabdus antumapuensis]MCA6221529.1 hypothetical protein [Photorhabdus antumapuensis]
MIILLLGAPATGKSTLGPLLNAIIRLNDKVWKLDSLKLNTLLDQLIESFAGQYFLSDDKTALERLLRLGNISVTDFHCLNNLRKSDFKCAEIDNFKDYRDYKGNLKTDLTFKAHAFIQQQVICDISRVLIPGTGMWLNRLLPLLEEKPNTLFKVVVPDPQLQGYFYNELALAVKRRSSKQAQKQQKFVTKEVMKNIYNRQQQFLSANGPWSKIKGCQNGKVLSNKIKNVLSDIGDPVRLNQETQKIRHELRQLLQCSYTQGEQNC